MDLINKVKEAVIEASITYRPDQIDAYERALSKETNKNAVWVLNILLENAKIAEAAKRPLCDDTGIPHVLIEVGDDSELPVAFLKDIKSGIELGLQELPARPMAVKGNYIHRIEQSQGLFEDPGKLSSPAILMDSIPGKQTKIHILMLGGGPEIRASTYRVFHKRDSRKVFEEVVTWFKSEVPMLGCTPCIPAVGIGRSHFEATSLMIKAMAYGNLNKQSDIENYITDSINDTHVGPLGLGGSSTALGSFVKIGPQRASGVRIVSMRPCCCVEPRKALIEI
ncbi:MAG: fumarate hydratase [Methanobacteriaceae archaeon]|jgi:fumarate hydratase subunit alpha|nr:fumarate hydratase [Methanobacteriaceae archaeon]MDP2837127.1 fumarate hydratase [Methanobacteriaceae archaeon]MDP3034958.1 fumarate hydratase [Methanobacteriaceae archaeon]MDP3485648.1 fumarate hydratase [Methanobacteriaceae archaeon]MDP3624084.1 fumarate hydratase [Methanobacteriaceae archaeon]